MDDKTTILIYNNEKPSIWSIKWEEQGQLNNLLIIIKVEKNHFDLAPLKQQVGGDPDEQKLL